MFSAIYTLVYLYFNMASPQALHKTFQELETVQLFLECINSDHSYHTHGRAFLRCTQISEWPKPPKKQSPFLDTNRKLSKYPRVYQSAECTKSTPPTHLVRSRVVSLLNVDENTLYHKISVSGTSVDQRQQGCERAVVYYTACCFLNRSRINQVTETHLIYRFIWI